MEHVKNRIDKVFHRFGSEMVLINLQTNEEISFRGFLQPLRYKNKMYLGAVKTPLGFDNSRKFLLLAPPEIDIKSADGYESAVECDGCRYSCDHREYERVGNNAVYSWSIVTLVKDGDEDSD